MKHYRLLIVSLLFALTQNAWCQDTIRIMSINLDQGAAATLQVIGEKIKSYQPDFVALQEVDMYPHRGRARHQYGRNFIAELSFYSDMQGVFGKAWDHPNGWDYGDGAMSKVPFTKSESFILKHKENTEPRQLLLLHTNIKGHDICFGSTHLCHEDKENRAMQLKQIKSIMRKQKEKIQIVCGDLNSHPTENLVRPIMKNWSDMLPEREFTFSSYIDKPTYRYAKYDYLLYYNKYNNIKVINYNIDCDPSITDHCICIADIVIY